jgi:hypothetical protein
MENNIQKAKLEKFKAMGIPVPMEKPAFEQPIVNVKDPKMLARIQEIKSGAKKGEFKSIITSAKEDKNFKPLPEPKVRSNPKAPQAKQDAPRLEGFAPAASSSELALAESLFDDTPVFKPQINRGSGQRLVESEGVDNMGSNFLSDFRARLQAKASTAGFAQNSNAAGFGFREQVEQNNSFDLNEVQEIAKSVASDVAKKVAAETLKTVLDGYLSEKGSLNENQKNTFKKVKDDIVLIEGKYYRLVPVKVKTK